MSDLSTLQIKIETKGADQAINAIDSVKNSGTNAKNSLKDLGNIDLGKSKSSFSSLQSSVDNTGSSFGMAGTQLASLVQNLAMMIGVSLSVAGALVMVKNALMDIDKYNVNAIATAASMSSKVKEGVMSQEQAYVAYKGFVLEMYEALDAATERHFSSGNEMRATFNALGRMGIKTSLEEADAIGVIADKIRLQHGGMVDSVQVMHEMRGLIEGYAGAHYQLAQSLERKLGPSWKELVREQIESGTLVTFLASQFSGLAVAAGDIGREWTSQKTTLDTLISQIGRGGLAGAYSDLVSEALQLNDYLRIHKDELITDVAGGWAYIKWHVEEVKKLIEEIANFTSKPVKWIIDVTLGGPFAPLLMGLSGLNDYYKNKPSTPLVPPVDNSRVTHPVNTPEEASRQAKLSALKQTEILLPGATSPSIVTNFPMNPPGMETPKFADKGGGGGKDREKELMNILDQLEKEYATLTEGMNAGVDKWYDHIINRINGVDQNLKSVEQMQDEATVMAKKVAEEKKNKIADEFNLKYAKSTGDLYAAIDQEYWNDLKKFGDTEENKAKVAEMRQRQITLTQLKFDADKLARQGEYLGKMAGTAPLLSQQLMLQSQILDIENQQAQNKINQMYFKGELGKIGSQEALDEKTKLEALQSQVQKYAELAQIRKGWMLEGPMGGMKEFFTQHLIDQETAGAKQMIEMLKGIKDTFSNALSDGLTSFMKGEKGFKLEDIGWKIVGSINKALADTFVNNLITMVANAFGISIPTLTTGAMSASAILAMGGMEAGANLVSAATMAATILKSGGGFAGGLTIPSWSNWGGGGSSWEGLGLGGIVPEIQHAGGRLGKGPVYAHQGWSGLKPHEIPFIGLDSERVLSPAQTRDYEAGMRAGGGASNNEPPQVNVTVNNNTNTQVKTSQGPNGDLIIQIDEMMHQAYQRNGKFRKALSLDGVQQRTVQR